MIIINTKLTIVIAVVLVTGLALFLLTSQPKTNQSTPTKQVTNAQPTTVSPSLNKTTETTNVIITTSGFTPETIKIKPGTKVVWTNKGGETVTVNSDLHPTHLLYPPLNLGELSNGASVELVFDKPGTLKYHNHLNPSQTGTVIVE